MSDNGEIKKEYHIIKDTSYNESKDNYIIPEDITVTITLREYRNLVMLSGSYEYRLKTKEDEHYKALREKNGEIEQLKIKIDKLLHLTKDEEDCDEDN